MSIKVAKDDIITVRFSKDYKLETLEVNKSSNLSVQVISGGSWATIVEKK